MINELDFVRARECEDYRPAFIKCVEQNFKPRFVRRISYELNQLFNHNGKQRIAMGADFSKLSWLGIPYIKPNIIVYPFAFAEDFHPEFQDFLSSLRDHEFFHAREIYYNPSKILSTPTFILKEKLKFSGKTLREIMTSQRVEAELRAFENQLSASNSDVPPITKEYRDEMTHNYEVWSGFKLAGVI